MPRMRLRVITINVMTIVSTRPPSSVPSESRASEGSNRFMQTAFRGRAAGTRRPPNAHPGLHGSGDKQVLAAQAPLAQDGHDGAVGAQLGQGARVGEVEGAVFLAQAVARVAVAVGGEQH